MAVKYLFPSLAIAFGVALMPTAASAGAGHGVPFGKAGDVAEADRTIKVIADDIHFDIDRIDVKAGETIRFVITNTGAALHEFNIATPDGHKSHQAEMQKMMDHGMMSADGHMGSAHAKAMPGMTHNDPNSVLVKPGETRELVWTFTKATHLEFACNVPGHYEAGMKGEIIVQTDG